MSIEAMKLALEALEARGVSMFTEDTVVEDAITALRQSIREAEEQAPWDAYDKAMADQQGCDHCNHPLYAGTKCKNCGHVTEQAEQAQPVALEPNHTQLKQIIENLNRCLVFDSKAEFLRVWIRDWTAHKLSKVAPPPRQPWVGLTDAEIALIAAACGGLASDFLVDVARAIEAKLKEKNT